MLQRTITDIRAPLLSRTVTTKIHKNILFKIKQKKENMKKVAAAKQKEGGGEAISGKPVM